MKLYRNGTERKCTIYFKQGTGWVGRISDDDNYKIAILIGESKSEIRFMAHGQYGVSYKNMRIEEPLCK